MADFFCKMFPTEETRGTLFVITLIFIFVITSLLCATTYAVVDLIEHEAIPTINVKG